MLEDDWRNVFINFFKTYATETENMHSTEIVMQATDILLSLKLNQTNQSCPQIGYIHEKLIKALKKLTADEREINQESLFNHF